MASSLDTWMIKHNEGLELSEEINKMISEKSSLAEKGYDLQRHASSLRRKITILATRVEDLESLLPKSPEEPISQRETNRCKGMIENLRSKAHQMVSAMDMSNFASIDSCLGPDDIRSRVIGMDNQGIVGFQRQVMRGQDKELEKLEKAVIDTKRTALAIKEELSLHTKLINDLGHPVDVSASGLKEAENSLERGVCMTIIYSVLGFFGLA